MSHIVTSEAVDLVALEAARLRPVRIRRVVSVLITLLTLVGLAGVPLPAQGDVASLSATCAELDRGISERIAQDRLLDRWQRDLRAERLHWSAQAQRWLGDGHVDELAWRNDLLDLARRCGLEVRQVSVGALIVPETAGPSVVLGAIQSDAELDRGDGPGLPLARLPIVLDVRGRSSQMFLLTGLLSALPRPMRLAGLEFSADGAWVDGRLVAECLVLTNNEMETR